jgi:hypothetical protein
MCGAWIETDLSDSDRFQPEHERNISIDLMNVRNPEAARRFVADYGVLFWGIRHEATTPATYREDWPDFTKAKTRAEELRSESTNDDDRSRFEQLNVQPSLPTRAVIHVQDVIDAAEGLRELGRLARLLKRASTGDKNTIAELRSRYTNAAKREPRTDEFLRRLTRGLGDKLSRAAEGASVLLTPSRRPGKVTISLRAPNLLGYCYLDLARMLTVEEYIDTCECGTVFAAPDDRRRRGYCSATCSNRARQRRHRERHGLRPGSLIRT